MDDSVFRQYVAKLTVWGTFSYLFFLTALVSVGIYTDRDLLGPGKELWFFVAGWMTAKSSTIIDHLWSSSVGSEEKSKILTKIIENGRGANCE